MHLTTEPENTWSKILQLKGEIDHSSVIVRDSIIEQLAKKPTWRYKNWITL